MKRHQQFTYDVFLSHNSKDKELVRPVAERLKDAGYKVWFDEWTISHGDDIYLSIESGLEESRILLLFLSENALQSDWVKLERSTAIFRDPSNKHRRFIPIILSDCDLPDTLKRYKYIDLRKSITGNFEEIITACSLDPIAVDDKEKDELSDEIQNLFKQGEDLVHIGQYSKARELFEIAKKIAEDEKNEYAIIKAEIDIAETNNLDNVNLTHTKETLLKLLIKCTKGAFSKFKPTILQLLGDAEYLIGNPSEAKSIYQDLATYYKSNSTNKSAYIGLFQVAVQLGNYEEAHQHLDEAIEYFRREIRVGIEVPKNKLNLGASLSSKGKVYYGEGKIYEAEMCLKNAEELFREIENKDNLARTLKLIAEIQLSLAKWENGYKLLIESVSLFEAVGNYHWQVLTIEVLAKLFFQIGRKKEAVIFSELALKITEEKLPKRELPAHLLRHAQLLKKTAPSEALKYILRAKDISTTENDSYHLAEAIEGEMYINTNEQDELPEKTIRLIISHLINALSTTEVKGKRAHCFQRIAGLQVSIKNYSEAEKALKLALTLYSDLHDAFGTAETIGMLSGVARGKKDRGAEEKHLVTLIDFTQEKHLPHHQASALNDLAMFKLSNGDIITARKLLDECQKIALEYSFNDIISVLEHSMKRLNDAEEFYRPQNSSIPKLSQELISWCAEFPKMKEAILPLWYFLHRSELWSLVRVQVGLKLMIVSERYSEFEENYDRLKWISDLFIWGRSFIFKKKLRTELIPFPNDFHFPSTTEFAFFKENSSKDIEAQSKALIEAIADKPYLCLMFDGENKYFPGIEAFAFGRHLRLPNEILKFMTQSVNTTKATKRRLCLPLDEEKSPPSFYHVLLVSFENGLLPVFANSLPYSKDVQSCGEFSIEFPIIERPEASTHLKMFMTKFSLSIEKLLADSRENSNHALLNFKHQWIEILNLEEEIQQSVAIRIYLLKFQAGLNTVIHPVLVV